MLTDDALSTTLPDPGQLQPPTAGAAPRRRFAGAAGTGITPGTARRFSPTRPHLVPMAGASAPLSPGAPHPVPMGGGETIGEPAGMPKVGGPLPPGGVPQTDPTMAGMTPTTTAPFPTTSSMPSLPQVGGALPPGGIPTTDPTMAGTTPQVPTGAGAAASPTAPIDPANDLRAQSVLPQDSAALASARGGMIDASAGVAGFDRAKAIRDAMSQFGTMPTDVSAGPAFDAGKDYSGDINSADDQTMSALGKVTGRDRAGLISGLRDQNVDFLGNTDIAKGPAIDAGPSKQGALDEADTMAMDATRRATGTDRTALATSLRDQFGNYLKPTDLQAGAAVDPTGSARLDKYGAMTDEAASKLSTVDRVQLAKDTLAQFDDAALPEHELALRQLSNKFAALGGNRSGKLRTSYGDEDLTRLRDRDLLKRQLVTAATEGTIQDQLNKTNTLSGLESGLASREAGVRGELRTERDYGTGVQRENIAGQQAAKTAAAGLGESAASATQAARTGQVATAQSLADSLAGRESARRGVLAGERTYNAGIDEGNVSRRLATKSQAANLATGEADATMAGDANALSAARGVSGDLSSRQVVRGATQRADRAYGTSVAQANADRALAAQEANRNAGVTIAGQQGTDGVTKALAARDLFGTLSGEAANNRTETRGERAYQGGLEKDAYDRGVTQDQVEQSDATQQQQRALALLNAGEAGNPASILTQLANSGGLDANTIAMLAKSIGQGGAGATGPAAPAGGGIDPSALAAWLKQLTAGAGGGAPTTPEVTEPDPNEFTH